MSHTPGQWVAVPEHDLLPWTVRAGDLIMVVQFPCDALGQIIHGSQETEANARLIAAAPDLLVALKQIQFGFNFRRCPACAGWNMSDAGETDMVHTKDCIVALAIAKAEGK